MQSITFLFTFITVWSLVMFLVLPFGVRPPENPKIGQADGAPDNPRFWRKVGISAAIALILTILFHAVFFEQFTEWLRAV